jgi:DNA-binding response OmpR family regulator
VEKRAVLIVEDEKPLAKAIGAKFVKFGFDVVTARTVDQAEGYLHDGVKVNIIWLDHYLIGKKNGLDFVAHLKNHSAHKKLPIFVVSNTAGLEKQRTYLQLGVSKYYVKSDNRLDEIIRDIIGVVKKSKKELEKESSYS